MVFRTYNNSNGRRKKIHPGIMQFIHIDNIELRQDRFVEFIMKHKDQFKTKKDIKNFGIMYPEFFLGFKYLESLEKMFIKEVKKLKKEKKKKNEKTN